ncbi:MAG: hypothetical protein ACI97A_002968 [Planctomycetota bacterium]
MFRALNQSVNLFLLLAFILAFSPSLLSQEYEASSFQSGNFHPRSAFDGDIGSRWSANFKEKTGWIQVTYATKKKFKSVTIKSGISDLKGAPKTFDILSGEPGKLKVVKTITGNTEDDKTFKFSSKPARVWRIDVKERINTRWSPTISEIVFNGDGKAAKTDERESAGGESGPQYTAWTKSRGGNSLGEAFDGDESSRFEANKSGPGWIAISYPEEKTFDAVMMRHVGESGKGVPRDFTVQYKSGKRWKDLGTKLGNFTNQPKLRFKEMTAKEWRVKLNNLVDSRSRWSPGEIKFIQLGEVDFLPEPDAQYDQEKVNKAIDHGMEWLRKKQKSNGNFPSKSAKEFPMGVMSLGALALRKSGLDRNDPMIQDFVTRIAKLKLDKTYSVALYAMFLRSVSKTKYADKLQTLADWLAERQGPEGLWGYPTGRVDLSNAQYALLGLKAAVEGGAKVDKKIWQKSWDWFIKHPEKNGGYRYVPKKKLKEDPITGSMTAAALACLKICQGQLPKDRARARASVEVMAEALEWLGDHFVAEMNPGSGRSHYYYLYGVERVGSYYKLRRLGKKPWYASGAKHLVEFQFSNGSWHNNFEDTCFALLFLNRASTSGN